MEFLAPVMLAGALAVAIPIAIHLIGRRRARVVEFAAVDFLLGSDRRVARKLRLRNLLLLLARALVCLAIPLAFAKPLTSCETDGPEVARGAQAVVLVVDDALPTRYELGGGTIADRVTRKARAILDQLGPDAEVALVRTSEGAPEPSELARNHRGIRRALEALEPTARPPDLTTALARAEALLAESDEERRTAFLISPLFSSGFREELAWPDDGPSLEVVPVAEHEELDSLAITGLSVAEAPGAGERRIEVTAELRHDGQAARDEEELRLLIDGEVAARSHLSVDAGEHKQHRFSTSAKEGQQTARVEVALSGGALPPASVRHTVAELQESVDVLLVNGSPSSIRYQDELFYLRSALRPGDRGDSGIQTRSVTPGELDDLDLEAYDVIVLANVPALSQARAKPLTDWLEDGGGLFVTSGDNLDPMSYETSMEPLLPGRLQSIRDVTYGATGREREARALTLAELDGDHPALSGFSAESEALGGATFSKLAALGAPGGPAADVLARYSDGAPALVEARRGEGRVVMFTSSIDRDWNDFPIFPGYPPLMQSLIRYLGGIQDSGDLRVTKVGSRPTLRVRPREARLAIEAPGGDRQVLEGEELAGRQRVRLATAEEPGIYRVLAAAEGEDLARDSGRDFAAQIAPHAASLERETVASIRGAAADDAGDRTHDRRVELWHAVAAALLILLLGEALLVWRSS